MAKACMSVILVVLLCSGYDPLRAMDGQATNSTTVYNKLSCKGEKLWSEVVKAQPNPLRSPRTHSGVRQQSDSSESYSPESYSPESGSPEKNQPFNRKTISSCSSAVRNSQPNNELKTYSDGGDQQKPRQNRRRNRRNRSFTSPSSSASTTRVRASDDLKYTLWKAAKDGQITVLLRELKRDRSLANLVTNGNGVRLLQWAASYDQKRAVEILLDYGADVCAQDNKGRTALAMAATKGYLAIVQLLHERGADLTVRDKEGKTALHWSVEFPKKVRYLVDQEKSLISVTDADGKDPLQRAAGMGFLETVNILLRKGASVDTRDNQKRTALWWAAGEGHVLICDALIKAGADINVQDEDGQSIVAWAAHKNRENVVRLLVQKVVRLDLKDKEGKIPLHWAVEHPALVRLMLPGSDVNALDTIHSTPLTWAAYFGVLESVELLLEKGALVNLCDNDGKTAAALAADQGHVDVVKALAETHEVKKEDLIESLARASYAGSMTVLEELIKQGVDVNSVDRKGKTALYWAAVNSQVDALSFLISQGANVNKSDTEGQTALSWAAYENNALAVQLLLFHKADPCSKDVLGKTPLHWAQSRRVAYLLVEAGAKIDEPDNEGRVPLAWAAFEGDVQRVDYLLSRGASIDSVDEKGRSPLYWSVEHETVVRRLLQETPDLTLRDSDGLDAFQWAVIQGNLSVVILLADVGADLNSSSYDKTTPLMRAVLLGHTEIAEYLIDKDVSKNDLNEEEQSALAFVDQSGNTLLHLAAISGNYRILTLLLERKIVSLNAQCFLKKRTALHWALRMCKGAVKKEGKQNPVSVVIALLVELLLNGATSTIKDAQGLTPYQSTLLLDTNMNKTARGLLQRALIYPTLSTDEQESFRGKFLTLFDKEYKRAVADDNRRDKALLEKIRASCLLR